METQPDTTPPPRHDRSVAFDRELMDRIDAWRMAHLGISFSHAVRELVKLGLDAKAKP